VKPDMPQLLGLSAMTLGANVVPQLTAIPYAAGDASIIALINILTAQEVDRAADTLVRENTAIRALLDRTKGISGIHPTEPASEPSLKISALETENAVLKSKLIALHEWSETVSHLDAQSVNQEIWGILRRGAQDRTLVLPAL
jgi:hypothetical protein